MSSDSDAISHFTALDELIQIIYQGSARFVIISSVDDSSWTIHIGLTGDNGRWWRGRWTEKDVRAVIVRLPHFSAPSSHEFERSNPAAASPQGSKVSGFLVESFVEKLADTFVKGELSIGDWNAAKGAPIQLVFGTHAKTPIQVPLTELSHQEAAASATKVFAEIALQAQARKCRLYPSSLELSSPVPAAATTLTTSKAHSQRHSPDAAPVSHASHRAKGKEKAADTSGGYKRKAEEAEEEIQALKAELQKTKKRQNAMMTDPSKLLPVNRQPQTMTKGRGVSLANPTKKARKYKPIEFESDDE
ncbi:hypothetical protein BN946_scf185042.g164 [Trametes cinnabarina]|uniref:Uncharacterized protein n=1 Tax=Pycnoporus cinnabarinus TaxID=5643 RepID=A0A060S4B6_PYCCI|nr:hypothetical protein BN946_scf185042.g164 [Trametes cinnabarina]